MSLQLGTLAMGTAALPAVSSIASSVASSIASSVAQDKIPWSALDFSGQTITSISGSAIGGQVDTSLFLPASASGDFYPNDNPSGFITGIDLSDYAKQSSLSSKFDASASSLLAPSGDYAYSSSVSGKLDASASSLFAPSGDYAYNSSLSGYIPTSASSSFMPSGDYQTAGDYAYNSAVSSKLDASASSDFLLASASGEYLFTGVTTDETLTGNGTTGSALGVAKMELTFDTATMTVSGLNGSATAGVRDGVFFPGSSIQIVTYTSEATANNVIYIVTGTP